MDIEESLPPMIATMDRDFSGFSAGAEVLPAGPAANMPMVMQTTREITAKRVAVPRHIPQILKEIREMAAAFGDTYVYSWEAKDRQKGGKSTIKGPTIKAAMMLVQAYGNCSVDMDIQETPTHWIFKAWFMDYEKGTSLSRLFQQRKNQNTGMKDADRQQDIVFQIGQSKAARNVVVNALSSFAAYAMEEAEKGLVAKFNSPEARERAWAFMNDVMDQHGIEMKRVEAVIGRREKDWTVPNLAKAYMMLRGVAEGMASADDQFPEAGTADEMIDETEAETKALKRREGRNKKDKAPEQAPAETKAPEAPQQAAADKRGDPGDIPAHLDRRNKAPAVEQGAITITGQTDVTTQESDLVEQENSGGEPDEVDVLSRIEQLFDGLDDDASIEEVREKVLPAVETLSKAGQDAVKGYYNAAQARSTAKKAAAAAAQQAEQDRLLRTADEASKASADAAKLAAPAAASARRALFNEND